MTYNEKDGVYYMTAAEYAADTTVKAKPTAKAYVYETGKMYVTDGAAWHELGVADAT
jgi:hypothetical protein